MISVTYFVGHKYGKFFGSFLLAETFIVRFDVAFFFFFQV